MCVLYAVINPIALTDYSVPSESHERCNEGIQQRVVMQKEQKLKGHHFCISVSYCLPMFFSDSSALHSSLSATAGYRVCWPLFFLCCPFCIFERCLDSNPESWQARYQLFSFLHYTVKKVSEFPVPRRDVTTKLSLGGNNGVITELFLPRGSLVSDIPAGDGKLVNLFLRCKGQLFMQCCF